MLIGWHAAQTSFSPDSKICIGDDGQNQQNSKNYACRNKKCHQTVTFVIFYEAIADRINEKTEEIEKYDRVPPGRTAKTISW